MNKLTGKINPFRWVLAFIAIAFISIGAIFSLNYIVDPFGTRNWIVEKHYKPIIHERSEKFTYLFNQEHYKQYDCIILGSSRVMSMIPSKSNATQNCYNFGVHVANNPEKLFILQEWLKRAPLKKVYLGNELYNMHPYLHPLELNPQRFINGSEGNYLSFSTLKISIKVLKNFIYNKPQVFFETDGSIRYVPDEEAINKGEFNHSYKHFTHLSQDAVEGNFINNPFKFESKALKPLQKIKALCDQHHIQLYTFITPTFYETQRQMQSHSKLAQETQKFQDDLLNIFGKVYNFDVDTQENRDPVNFYDPVHYRPIIGKKMMDRMDNQGDYGVLLIKP